MQDSEKGFIRIMSGTIEGSMRECGIFGNNDDDEEGYVRKEA